MLPMREGAGVAPARGPNPSAEAPAVLSALRRSGESCGDTKPSRTGRSRSGVRVWARAEVASNAVSARIAPRHGHNARKVIARLRRPLAGPDITIEIPQPNHLLRQRFPTPCEPASREDVVNGVKTSVVNGRLRTGCPRRIAGPAMLRRCRETDAPPPGTQASPWNASLPWNARHGQSETADGRFIRHR